jgi:DNA-binding GntR family transcriptional regulator
MVAPTSSADTDAVQERRVPATERVLDHILGEMDAGRLNAGSRVNAARIASTLSLSAAPVREALSVLAGRGVINLMPDRGAVMRPFSATEVAQLWALIAPIASVGLTLAAQAVARGADTAPLERQFAAICNDPLDAGPLNFMHRLNEWHYLANAMGGNPFVDEVLERLGITYWNRYLVQLIDVAANVDGYIANYRRMHDAVVAGDGLSAAAATQFHAEWSVARINAAATARPARKARRSRHV